MIDLKQFCGTDEFRPYIHSPFSFGEFTYATTGIILVRVARRSDAREGGKPMTEDGVVRALALDKEASFISVANVALPADDDPIIQCAACGGEGEKECDACGHSDDCKACNGLGSVGSLRSVAVGAVAFDAKYIEQILSLPNPEIDRKPAKEKPCRFRFDGGIGAVMPLSVKQKRHLGDLFKYIKVSAE